MKNEQKVAIIGLGYVGLPLALLSARKGHPTIGVDQNIEKIDKINERVSPFSDDEITKHLRDTTLRATTSFSEIEEASIVIICVPTPVYDNYQPNLEPIKAVSESISKHLRKGQLIILESTVNPGVCEDVIAPILEKSGLKTDEDYYLAHCPERINPGDSKWNVENIPRVLGSNTKIGLDLAFDFYSSILTAPIKKMKTIKEAEAVKVVENSFRDINIAFVNELAQSFEKFGIDVVNVIDGAATKPFAFMPHYPGCGVGGHCIPVDPYYLIESAKQNGFHHDLLAWARRVNNFMPKYTADQTVDGLSRAGIPVYGSKVTVLGLSYKPEIDDCRESPSDKIIEHLRASGAKVEVFDPHVMKNSTVKNLDEALTDSKAIVIATGHDYFKTKITPKLLLKYGVKVMVDGRNIFNKKAYEDTGVVYRGIGR